jgi:hypothetical protein
MAISVDYLTKIISVPQADLTPVGGAFYEMDINWFHLQLRDWEDDENGIFMPDTHIHTDPVDIGSVTVARVVKLINGYTVTFEDGSYVVTLTGANSNIIENTNLNSVSVRSSNSAGLVATPELQYSSYEGAVWYKSTSTSAGTVYPIGTRRVPVNNLADAITIAAERGLGTIHLLSNATLSGLNFSGLILEGENPVDITVSCDPTANTNDCTFKTLTLNGTLDGDNQIYECLVGSVTGFNGIMRDCILYNAVITLGGGKLANIINCVSGVASPTAPVIDMGGTGQELALQSYTGSIQIQNKTGLDDVAIDIRSGEVILTNTVDAGEIVLRGVGKWTNEATFTGTATVFNELLTEADLTAALAQAIAAATNAAQASTDALSAETAAQAAETAALAAQAAALQAVADIAALEAPDNATLMDIYRAHFNRRKWDKVADTITLYQDNGIGALAVFDTNDDLSEITPQ